MVPVYNICCSDCGRTIWLLETILEQIVRNPLVSARGAAAFLVLVCSGCKRGFRYNYTERQLVAEIPEPDPSTRREDPIAFAFRAECADGKHKAPVELIAIRDFGTTRRDVIGELLRWNVSDIFCDKGHPLFFPDPEKSYER